MNPTATSESTIRIVLVSIAVITLLLFAGVFWLIDQGKDLTAVAALSGPAGIGLGLLGASLNNTRTVAGANPPAPAELPPPPT